MGTTGEWQKVSATSVMQSDRAYFIFASAPSDFTGPIKLERLPSDGLVFTENSLTRTFDLRNTGTKPALVKLQHLPSATPPPGTPVNAGAVPMNLKKPKVEGSADQDGYLAFDEGTTIELTLAPGELRTLTVTMDASRLAEPPLDTEYLYQGILRATDDRGFVLNAGISATGLKGENATTAKGGVAKIFRRSNLKTVNGAVVPGKEGLWVGEVRIDKVAQVAVDPLTPVPVERDLRQRLILHANSTDDSVRLLQQVVMLTRTETVTQGSTGESTTQNLVALVTDDALLKNSYPGFLRRGEKSVGMRISSTAYPFFNLPGQPANTLLGSGNFEDGTAARTDALSFTYTLDYRDKLNPFVHQYHPDHDNLNAEFNRNAPLPEGRESFTMRHEITLNFTPTNPDPLAAGVTSPTWLSTEVGGRYTEKIYGLFRTDPSIKVNDLLYKRLGASAYWTFDETSGRAVTEAVSGKITNANVTPGWVAGRVGNAIDMNGNQVLYGANNNPSMPVENEPYTISVWVNPRDMGGSRYVITWGSVAVSRLNGLVFSQGQLLNHWFGAGDLLAPLPAPITNKWTHVACTFDGKTRVMYANGVAIKTDSPTGHAVPTTSEISIGFAFNGLIDELSVYKRGLSADEIGQLANMGAAGNSTARETPITVSGYFKLSRVSPENRLNPPPTTTTTKGGN